MSGSFYTQTFATPDSAAPATDHGTTNAGALHETQQRVAHQRALNLQRDRPSAANLPDVQIVDQRAVESTARALKAALDRTNFMIQSPDVWTVETLLRNASPAELPTICHEFYSLYGKSLYGHILENTSRIDADKLLPLLTRTDNKPDVTSEIKIALEQCSWPIQGPSHEATEANIRAKLSRMTSAQIDELRQHYSNSYGISLDEALLKNPHLSDSTKAAVAIYLHGADKRSDENTLKLFDIAIKEHDLQRLQEASSGASPAARQKFLDAGGEQRLKDAFQNAYANMDWKDAVLNELTGGLYSLSDTIDTLKGKKVDKAVEIAKDGRPSAATKIYENRALLGNNREAIAQVLEQMSDSDRHRYFLGQSKANADQHSLSPQDRDAVQYYTKLHVVLSDASGRLENLIGHSHDRELLKWEDMIRTKSGGLISKLADQGGYIYNNSKDSIISTIENMSQSDWNAAKQNIAAFDHDAHSILNILLTNDADRKQALNLLHRKLAATTYQQSINTGKRDILDTVQDSKGLRADVGRAVDPFNWFTSNSGSIVHAIATMSEADQQKYKTNAQFHQQLDREVKAALGNGTEFQAARRALDNISAGKPADDLIVDLYMSAAARETNNAHEAMASNSLLAILPPLALTGQLDATVNGGKLLGQLAGSGAAASVHLLDQAMNGPSGPELRSRLKTDEAFSKDLTKALHACLTQPEFDKYAKPMLDGGNISLEARVQIDRSLLHDDKKSILNGLTQITDQERTAILSDAKERQRVLGSMSPAVQELALKIIQQRQDKDEDKLRAAVLGYGYEASDIKELLVGSIPGQALSAQQRAQIRHAYADKYQSDALADIAAHMSTRYRNEITQLLERPPQSAAEAIDRSEQRQQQSEGALGTKLVGHFWDGTDKLTTESLNEFQRQITQAARQDKQLSPQQVEQLTANYDKCLNLLRHSRAGMADAAVDAALAAGVIAGSFVPGVNFAILAGAGIVGGALLKPTAKAAMEGSDYDSSGDGVFKDMITGSVSGFVNTIGPGEMAAILKMGEAAGTLAAKEALIQATKQLGENLLAQGADKLAQDGMTKLVRDSIAHGMKDVDEASMQKLAATLVSNEITGYQRDAAVKQVVQQLEQQLQSAINKESRSYIQNAARRYALNAAVGAAGGGGGAAMESALDWDSNRSVGENLQRGAERAGRSMAIGAAGGIGFTALGDATGSLLRGRDSDGDGGRAPRTNDNFSLPLRKIDVNEDMTGRIASVSQSKEFIDHFDGKPPVYEDVRIYKLKGRSLEVSLPESYAKQMDELRSLRQTANLSMADNPTKIPAILAAKAKLANNSVKDALLPEQMGQLVDELPNPDKVRRIEITPYQREVKGLGLAAGDASVGGISFRVFPPGNKPSQIRGVSFHETAHLTQEGGGWDAFQKAADIEHDGYYARDYAKRDEHENFAVHFGENLVSGNPAQFQRLTEQAPLRSAIMGDILRQQIEKASSSGKGQFPEQFLARVHYIDENVMPKAKAELAERINAADPNAIKLVQSLVDSGNERLLNQLVDIETARTAATKSQTVEDQIYNSRMFSMLHSPEGQLLATESSDNARNLLNADLSSGDPAKVKSAFEQIEKQIPGDSIPSYMRDLIDTNTLKSLATSQSNDEVAIKAAALLSRLNNRRLPDDVIANLFRIDQQGGALHSKASYELLLLDSAEVQIHLLSQHTDTFTGFNVYFAVTMVRDNAGKLTVLQYALNQLNKNERDQLLTSFLKDRKMHEVATHYLNLHPDQTPPAAL